MTLSPSVLCVCVFVCVCVVGAPHETRCSRGMGAGAAGAAGAAGRQVRRGVDV